MYLTRKVSLTQYPHVKVTFPLVISIYTGNFVKWYILIKKKKKSVGHSVFAKPLRV